MYIGGVLKANSYINDTVIYENRLGWITYFSNDYEIQIPNDIEGFDCEYAENGKYLIATREDFTVSKEAYQVQKEKLLKAMEYLGRSVPGYLRHSD